MNEPASQPGGHDLTESAKPVRHEDTQYGTFAANRQQTTIQQEIFEEEDIFEETPRAGTIRGWLDVVPGTTARRAREEAT
jgi:hypothetical protein